MESRRRTTRAAFVALLRWTVIVGVATLVASCGLQRSAVHGKGGQAGGSATGTAKCGPADLTITLDVRAAGVAAGNSYIPLDFTSHAPGACLLSGFPAVALATSGAGQRIGTAAVNAPGQSAQTMELKDGQTAHIWLRLVDVANLPAAACRPVTAAGLLVTLPGQRRPIFVSHPLVGCKDRVPGTDILTIEPFHPGRARPGTAQ